MFQNVLLTISLLSLVCLSSSRLYSADDLSLLEETIDDSHPYCLSHDVSVWHSKLQGKAVGEGEWCLNQTKCDDPGVRDKHGNNVTVSLNIIVLCKNSELGLCVATQQDVMEQMAQLRIDFVNTGIYFDLKRVMFVDSEYHSLPPNRINGQRNLEFWNSYRRMQNQLAYRPDENINIFVANVENSGMMGMGVVPWDPSFLTANGGSLIVAPHFGKGQKTLAHELGHNFGLYHTFRGVSELNPMPGCDDPCREPVHDTKSYSANFVGDRCQDTRATPTNHRCENPAGRSQCEPQEPWGNTDLDNIMGYTPDDCMKRFTPNQIARAKCHLCQISPSVLVDSHLCPVI